MGLFQQMGQHKVLIMGFQHIGRAPGGNHQAAALGQGLQQQMHFRIVAQRLIVTHALHRIGNGFFIIDAALIQIHIQRKPLLYQASQNFQLHFAHDLHEDLLQPVVPHHMQLGVFLFQLPHFRQEGHGIRARRQRHPVGHDRFQHRSRCARLIPQALSSPGAGKAGNGQKHTGCCRVHCRKFLAAVKPQLHGFFFQQLVLCIFIGNDAAHRQTAAGNFQPAKPVSLGIPGNFVHSGAESLSPLGPGAIGIQHIQQFLHALQLQCRAEAAGE